jgi:hypothetical protein
LQNVILFLRWFLIVETCAVPARLTLPANRFSLAMFGEPNRHRGDAESLTRERQ